ncbi:hypothetical protein [Deinococcus sp. S9]|uniref:hypothetical protein n=1 Tax=Deinococcus sp. S9 TaxID=2545754 RepID=UPI0010550043|nr:hypothetical protein [Deinococcus sp. S9]TDE84873.1 hypothetical protein E0686_14740 [Deinococcus sp. S9]
MKSKVFLPLLLVSGAALAQDTSPLQLVYDQVLIQTVTQNGKTAEKRTPGVTRVRPGEVLAQTVVARNTAGRALANIRIQLPVPKGMVYLAPDGSVPADVRTEYSIDGGKTFAPAPLKKTVTVTENGKTVTREVEVNPNEYQAVRWTISTLNAGAEQKLGFRVQVK